MNPTLAIEVTAPNGFVQVLSVDAAEARIGSAAHCEVRLPLGDAAPEHVLLRCTRNTVSAKVLAQFPVTLADGETFEERELDAHTLLEIGETRLKVSAALGLDGERKRANAGKSSPWVYVVAPALIAYTISELPRGEGGERDVPRRAPALFSAASPCPESAPESALAFGRERLELADSKRERRPFHAADGVRAVNLYRTAAACLDAAGEPSAAANARGSADRLALDLDESYRTHRVRLEHALDTADYLVASREVRALLDLTSSAGGDYVAWLQSLERRLKLRQENKT